MQEPTNVFHIIRGVLTILFLLGIFGWIFFRSLKKSEDPVLLIVKWSVTAVVLGFMVYVVRPFSNVPLSWPDIVAGLIGGGALTILWRRSIGEAIARPFASLYDGGSTEIEPQAYYSIAESKRKRGLFNEAVAEIHKQLARFPTDVPGQMLLAEIEAEDMKDLRAADVTIQRFCNQPGHAPRNIAFALNMMADWHLKYGLDRDSARLCLEEIGDLFPDTDLAQAAQQRIAHLASTERMLQPHDRIRVAVPEGVKNIGLLMSSAHLAPKGEDPEQQAEELTAHLTTHPQDAEAREKLAAIYSSHYTRLDLAGDQLEQLIELPNQPPKNMARWLNQLADMQIRRGLDYDTVRKTLERIIERFPDHSSAHLARNRIDTLKLELKGKDKNADVKLGTYEQYVGLKQSRPGTG